MKKIANQETEVSETCCMNDRDYLNDILESEKNISVNMATFLNEASNEKLYKKIFPMFTEIKDNHRDLYELAFQNGWYQLEEAEQKNINEKKSSLNKKIQELECEGDCSS